MQDKQRKAFKKWAETDGLFSFPSDEGTVEHNIAFAAWQAATAHMLKELDSPELVEEITKSFFNSDKQINLIEYVNESTDSRDCRLAQAALAVIKTRMGE